MIINLFSVFDPITSFIQLPLNWLRSFLGLFFLPFLFWLYPSRITFFWQLIFLTLYKEFKNILGNNAFNGSTFLFINLFILILFNNFLGLFPYIFTSSSHLIFTLRLSFPLWLRFIIYGWINNTTHIFCHLVPQGTPILLIPFIVCIETIRNIIRPSTLAIRLRANIIAGHLLLTLLGNIGPSSSFLVILILIFTQILLLTLEFAVAIIQSYVFSVLSTLYSRETN